nr:hypothetical protein [Tanacetum cinerariifolium]
MEYEAEMKRNPWKFYSDISMHESLKGNTNIASKGEFETVEQEVSTDTDEHLDEWLNAKMGKCMCRQDKENEEDDLIDILRSLVGEYLGDSVNIMPKSIFSHLKLAGLKETDMVVADMTKKVTLGIVENILAILSNHTNPDSADDSYRNEAQVPILEKMVSRWHVCKPVRVFYDNECGKDCGMWPTCNLDLGFCSGYSEIYGKGENGMLKQWMCFWDHERQIVGGNRMVFDDFLKLRYGYKRIDDTTRERRYYEWGDPYSRRFDEYKEEIENEIEQLAKEYDLRRKKYAFNDLDNALPLRRVNGSRFMEMIRSEMDEEGGATRKT